MLQTAFEFVAKDFFRIPPKAHRNVTEAFRPIPTPIHHLPEPITLLEARDGQCRYLTGHKSRGFAVICGEPSGEKCYCQTHWKITHAE